MASIGIDLGSKYIVSGHWETNQYCEFSEGGTTRIPSDDKANNLKTRLSIVNNDIFVGNLASLKFASSPNSSVGGCFEYFYKLDEENLKLLGDFNPSKIKVINDITYFTISINRETTIDIPAILVAMLYFEYIFYCALRKSDDIYYSRAQVANSPKQREHSWFVNIPNNFGDREIQTLQHCFEWNNYNNIALVRSALSIVLEYGYYHRNDASFQESTRTVIIDSGYSQTSFIVVNYKNKTACIEYIDTINTVSGRHYTEAMLRATLKDRVDEFKTKNRRLYLKAVEVLEKKLASLNLPQAKSVSVDLNDLLDDDDEDEIEIKIEEFDKECESVNACFKSHLDTLINFIKEKTDNVVNVILPVGGNMRVLKLRSILEEAFKPFFNNNVTLNQTVNMDECFGLGATLIGHLIEQKKLYCDEKTQDWFFETTLLNEPMKSNLMKSENPEYFVYCSDSVQLPTVNHDQINATLDALKTDIINQFNLIKQGEKEKANLHLTSSSAESKMIQCNHLCIKYNVDDEIQKIKDQCKSRNLYNWDNDRRFERNDCITKNTKWWKQKKETVKECVNALTELSTNYGSLKAKAEKILRNTPRSRLTLESVITIQTELEMWFKQVEEKKKELEDTVDLTLYQICKRGNQNK